MKIAHAGERAAERSGVAMSIDDLNALVAKIQSGRAVRMKDRQDGKQCWCVTHNGRALRVVYSPEWESIVTVLDPIWKRRA